MFFTNGWRKHESRQTCVLFSGGVTRASPQVDEHVGLLMSELEQTGLWGRINVVITSDHGMAQCSASRLVRLDDCLHPDNYTALELSPVASIIPLAGNPDDTGRLLPPNGALSETVPRDPPQTPQPFTLC